MDLGIFFNEWRTWDGRPRGGGKWTGSIPWPDGVNHHFSMYEHEGDPLRGPWCPPEPSMFRVKGAMSEFIECVPGAMRRGAVELAGWSGRRALIDIERWTLRRKDQRAREDGQRIWGDPPLVGPGLTDRYDMAGGENGSNQTWDSDTGSYLCRVIQRLRDNGVEGAWYGWPDYMPDEDAEIEELAVHPVTRAQGWLCLVHYFEHPFETIEQWTERLERGVRRAHRIAPDKPKTVMISFNNIYKPWGFVAKDKFIQAIERLSRGFKDPSDPTGRRMLTNIGVDIWGAIENEYFAGVIAQYARDVLPALRALVKAKPGVTVTAKPTKPVAVDSFAFIPEQLGVRPPVERVVYRRPYATPGVIATVAPESVPKLVAKRA